MSSKIIMTSSERDKIVFRNKTQNLQDQEQDQDRFSDLRPLLSSTVSDHITGVGERCELLCVARGGDLTAQRFFTVFSTQDGLSWHYNIVLLWIK